ncbi:MAG: acetate--CoA ligase family protein [Pseudomonadota bacterium]
MEFWTKEQMASIHTMLNPRSVAIVGATPRQEYGGRMLNAALRMKERVNVYAVNPKYDEILGVKSYKSITDLPEAPDVVAVVVPYKYVLSTLKEAHAKGTRAAVVISAGFAERGLDERAGLQQEVGNFARESGLRISGPNCLGLANVRDDIWITSSSRQTTGANGKVALVCQSGATLFGPFLARAADSGMGLSYVVSTGNEADLDFSDFARYLLDDTGTTVIAGFVEGFKDAAKFIEVAKIAAARGKPIVLIKIGRSDFGRRAASSHTAALTGSDALYDAVCKQYGVIRVPSYDDLLEVSQLLAQSRKPKHPGIAVVSHSGGICSLTADMCGQQGLDLPVLSDKARATLDGILKGFGWAANPADVTGRANSDVFPAIMEAMINEPGVGALAIASAGRDQQADQIIALREKTEKNVAFMWTGTRGDSTSLAKLKAAGVPLFYTPDSLARGLRHLVDYHAWHEKRMADPFASAPAINAAQKETLAKLRALPRSALSESESKQLIAAWGVPVSREVCANDAEVAATAAGKLGYPVVLKADSPDIPHKTEAGVVRLNLRTADEVRAAYATILANAKEHAPGAGINGVLVQEMVADGVEVIVGVSYDSQLGPTLLFGSGGVMVEVHKDVALRHCPITPAEAREMIAEVKGAKLLQGFRGKPACDVDALAQVLVNISHMAVNLEGQLAELDINPLLVLPKGQGVKAVDALVTLKGK